MESSALPDIPFEPWHKTRTTLHLFTQIVGKARLSLAPYQNHWWHVPLYLSARGLTTSVITVDNRSFECEFDLVNHRLFIRTSRDEQLILPLAGVSVADFYRLFVNALDEIGIRLSILARPFDPSRAGSDTPFTEDHQHDTYDPDAVTRFFHALRYIDGIFKEFRGRFLGKCSPVHFFWHSFDLAVTRFSGRSAEVAADADPVTRDAYSHEVISAGFWPGDNNLPEPAFYTYAHPEPPGLADQPLKPEPAWWQDNNGSHMALYCYDDFRRTDNPRQALLSFLQSAYEAAATCADWPRRQLETTRRND